jgi:hypothetical protein
MRCPTRGVRAVGWLIALRGGRLCEAGWNERVAQRPLRGGSGMVGVGCLTALHSSPVYAVIWKPTGGRICRLVLFACRVLQVKSSE